MVPHITLKPGPKIKTITVNNYFSDGDFGDGAAQRLIPPLPSAAIRRQMNKLRTYSRSSEPGASTLQPPPPDPRKSGIGYRGISVDVANMDIGQIPPPRSPTSPSVGGNHFTSFVMKSQAMEASKRAFMRVRTNTAPLLSSKLWVQIKKKSN